MSKHVGNKRMFSWMNPKLEVRDTLKYGKGIFAKSDLKKDEKIAIFGGYIMSLEEENQLPSEIGDYCHQIDDDFVLGLRSNEELEDTDYFNHSCEPNAGWNGQIFLVAIRDISKDEQITFDYAMVLGGDEPYSLNCHCGREFCRKIISNNDWKMNDIQDKYNGYFQYYLQEKINKLKNK